LQDGVDHEDQTCADALPEGADTLLSDDLLGGFDHAEGTFLGFTGFDVLWVRTISVSWDVGALKVTNGLDNTSSGLVRLDEPDGVGGDRRGGP
jgi:hypothetical protein